MTDPRILIADDLPRVCKALALELRGIATTTTADGGTDPYAVMLDAVERLTTDPPDLLLVDGLEGYGATLADIALSARVPVLAYTTKPEPFRRLWVDPQKRVALRVLEKPATRDELVAAVRSMTTTEVQDAQ